MKKTGENLQGKCVLYDMDHSRVKLLVPGAHNRMCSCLEKWGHTLRMRINLTPTHHSHVGGALLAYKSQCQWKHSDTFTMCSPYFLKMKCITTGRVI